MLCCAQFVWISWTFRFTHREVAWTGGFPGGGPCWQKMYFILHPLQTWFLHTHTHTHTHIHTYTHTHTHTHTHTILKELEVLDISQGRKDYPLIWCAFDPPHQSNLSLCMSPSHCNGGSDTPGLPVKTGKPFLCSVCQLCEWVGRQHQLIDLTSWLLTSWSLLD